jgi:hypothetical protein
VYYNYKCKGERFPNKNKGELNMKNVMSRAWEIAKEGADIYGGKVREYFATALRLAWKEIKNPAPIKARFELKNDTRKTRTWIAAITGTHPVYKYDRTFLNPDAIDEYDDKIFLLADGYYDVHNGSKRRYIEVANGEITTIDARDICLIDQISA